MVLSRGETGYYHALMSPGTCWRDKVKLVRYGWKHDTVYMACKEQLLLDWLSTALAGKKSQRVADCDAACVWQCLCDILRSERCQRRATRTLQTLSIKSSLLQTLVEALQSASNDKPHLCPLHLAISSSRAIVSSPQLCQALTLKFELVVQMTSACVDLYNRALFKDESLPEGLLPLLLSNLEMFDAALQNKANPHQVVQLVGSKLLLPLAVFSHFTKSSNHSCGAVQSLLESAVYSALFDRNIADKYELYLQIKTGTGAATGSSLPKFIDTVFTSLSLTSLGSSKYPKEAVQAEFATFYRQFLSAIHKEKPKAWLLLLWHLTCLLDMPINPHKPSLDVTPSDSSLLTLASLLEVLSESGVYEDVAVSTSVDGETVGGDGEKGLVEKWFAQLVRQVLASHSRGRGWCLCVQQLLQLDHTLIYKSSEQIIQSLCPIKPEVEEAQVGLLIKLLETSVSLRHLPAFISTLLTVVTKSQGDGILWPQAFLMRLGDVLGALTAAVTLEIWEQLLQAAVSQLDKKTNVTAVEQLLISLMSSCQLADDKVPLRIMTGVVDMMTKTKTELIMPRVKVKSKEICSTEDLSLLHTWGQLHQLLIHYSLKYPQLPSDSTPTPLTWCDLSPVYPDWYTPVEWKKILSPYKTATARHRYLMLQLMLQKLKALLLSSTQHGHHDGTTSIQTSVQNVIVALIGSKPEATEAAGVVWDIQETSLNETSYPAAYWSVLGEGLPLIAPFCSHDQLAGLSQSLVEICTHRQPSILDGLTEIEVGRSIVTSRGCQEAKTLQTSLVTAICQLMHQTIHATSPKKKNKKRKSGGGVMDVLGPLLEVVSRESAEEADTEEAMKSACLQLTQCMNDQISEACALSKAMLSHLKQHVQVLNWLPLKWLPRQYQAVSLISIIHLMTLTRHPEGEEVSCLCLSLLIRLLEGGSDVLIVMETMDAGKLISFVQSLSKMSQKLDKLCRHVCQRLMWFTCKSVTSIHHLNHLFTQLGASQATDHVSLRLALLRVVAEKLSRSHIPEKLSSPLHNLHATLQPSSLLEQTLKYPSPSTSSLPTPLLLELYGLKAFSAELLLLWTSDHAGESPLLRMIPGVHDRSCALLESSHCQDMEVLGSCVSVMGALCAGLHQLPELLSPLIPASFITHTWTLLLTTRIKITSTTERDFDLAPLKRLVSQKENQDKKQVFKESLLGDLKGSSGDEEKEEIVKKQGLGEASEAVEKVLSQLFTSSNPEQKQTLISRLLSHVNGSSLLTLNEGIVTSLSVWQHILSSSTEISTLLYRSAEQMLLGIQLLVLNTHSVCVVEACLDTAAAMLAHGNTLLSGSNALMPLTSCTYSYLDDPHLPLPVFLRLYPPTHRVTFTLLSKHKDTCLDAIPTFIIVANMLLRSLVWQGRQRQQPLDDTEVDALVKCAGLLDRLCHLMATSKVEFAKVAVYIVSEYTHHVQKVTLIPKVKQALLLAIYNILGICDRFAIAQLHTVLPAGPKEIFKKIYEEFTRYYKYTGRV